LFDGIYEPVPGFWKRKPLKADLVAALASPNLAHDPRQRTQPADAVHAVANARAAVASAGDAAEAIDRAIRGGREPAVDGALAGALAGACWGSAALPAEPVAALARLDVIERIAWRFAERQRSLAMPAERTRP
jgi:ADP-ribosylglycohydrolase